MIPPVMSVLPERSSFLFLPITRITGISAKEPISVLIPLNAIGLTRSIPDFCATKAVPQIRAVVISIRFPLILLFIRTDIKLLLYVYFTGCGRYHKHRSRGEVGFLLYSPDLFPYILIS